MSITSMNFVVAKILYALDWPDSFYMDLKSYIGITCDGINTNSFRYL